MYIPAAFAERRVEVLHAFIRQHSFGTLVTYGPSGLVASHLPFVLDAAGNRLLSHVARPNPQWQDFASGVEALAIFQGPHAYVSPRWYAAERAVPTWNYMTVHAHGRPRIIEDVTQVRELLAATVATYEGADIDAWRMEKPPQDFIDGMVRGVVAFSIELTRLEGKFKLSQNRSEADRAGVMEALLAAPTEMERAVAAAMEDNQMSDD